ncbi:MAG: HK97 gp10 family phage protein [Nitrososphaerota archaeon]
MSVKLQGLEELRALLGRLSDGLGQGVGSAAQEIARLFMDEARAKAPVRTGALRESIRMRREEGGKAVVEALAPYAGYVEYGSGPHVIEPGRAAVLRFEAGGETVYARRVRHPGSRPSPYWRPAFEEAGREAYRVFSEVVRRCL